MNLLNKLRKRDEMHGYDEHFVTFCNKFNNFSNTGALMLDSIYLYDTEITLKSYFWHKSFAVLKLPFVQILPYICNFMNKLVKI